MPAFTHHLCLRPADYIAVARRHVPHWLSLTSGRHKVPHVAWFAGAVLGFVVMMAVYLVKGEGAGAFIGAQLLNMAVFGAMISYGLQRCRSSCCGVTYRTSRGPTRVPWESWVPTHDLHRAGDAVHAVPGPGLPGGGSDRRAICTCRHRLFSGLWRRRCCIAEEDFAVRARAAAGLTAPNSRPRVAASIFQPAAVLHR